MLRISNKWKAVVGAIAGVVVLAGDAVADNVVDTGEAGILVAEILAAGALVYGLVWGAPKNEETVRKGTQ